MKINRSERSRFTSGTDSNLAPVKRTITSPTLHTKEVFVECKTNGELLVCKQITVIINTLNETPLNDCLNPQLNKLPIKYFRAWKL